MEHRKWQILARQNRCCDVLPSKQQFLSEKKCEYTVVFKLGNCIVKKIPGSSKTLIGVLGKYIIRSF